MTETAISPLRRRMIEDMTIRKLASKTQHDYVQRARLRGRLVEGIGYRFQTDDAARRARQRPQGSPRDALSAAAGSSARLVSHRAATGLAISRAEPGQPHDDAPAHSRLPCRSTERRDHQAG